jgi:CheY-like chemotaxis protein/HPt (histidine-containing phosphotransfer) domain-containing protein
MSYLRRQRKLWMDNPDTAIDAAGRFLAGTLHEIRTPIQTIISTIELLQDTKLDKEQTEYIRQIQFSADVLLELANEILDFTRIRSAEFKLEAVPFSITGLTEQVVDLVCIEAFNRGLEVVTDIDYTLPALVTGDPVRIQQILLNIVKNAVKFTEKGYILVTLRQQDGWYHFSVTDSGIGVQPDHRQHLFSDYYQGDASISRKYGGTGLGLSICKNLVSVMNGHIGFTPNPSGGSQFWFTLPLAAAQSRHPETSSITGLSEERILIVDDSLPAAQSLKQTLEGLGSTTIETATGGAAALAAMTRMAAERTPFTIAFIDMVMPVMDGWRLAADINRNPLINSTKLYLVVPEGQMGGEAKMKMLDWFNGYLYKPVKRSKLTGLLAEALNEPIDLEAADEEQPAAPELPAAGMQVLVAEDHPVNRKLMETFLLRFGATVFLAGDGFAALDQIAAHPDTSLIFMDIQMPGKNGLEAAVELRARHYQGIIIACTANYDPAEFAAYKKAGINDVLVKPFKSSMILNALQKWQSQQSRENVPENDWDIPDFSDTISGDTELGEQLLAEYTAQTAALLTEAAVQLEHRDFTGLRRTSHTLKGSSAAISAGLLAKHSGQLNEAAHAADAAAAATLIQQLTGEFAQLQKQIQNWRNTKK